ncbi:hypothetical protein CHU95_09545 [Niveispirillum lacus]|uniref:Uncharacterized protein n=1 Tax=Niveispirillum lacus TaxID=1981099 RepID=A0A255YZZ5_9PROT|nr:hypothetical protein [Niveispirillum lacus]OYQ34823.1 hypothetical protein CHU95_09545 [Niveispirillum lacus]
MNDKKPAAPGSPASKTSDWAALGADIMRLPDRKLLQIYRLLEQVGDKPEVSDAFGAMRPRLTTLRPPRRPALSRLFFLPAEDMLDDVGHYSRRLNRICRTTLSPCWQAVREHIPAALMQEVNQEVALVDYRDGAAIAVLVEPLWQAGAEALDRVMAECQNNLKYKISLFGRDDDVQRQLGTLRQILTVAFRIEKLKAALPPRPILDLAESHVEIIRTALIDLGKEDASLTQPLLLVLASRMQRPGELLRMLGEVRLGGTVAEKETLTREMSGYVVGNLLRQTSDFDRENLQVQGDPASLAAAAERLTDGLNSVNDTVQGLRDKDITAKMKNARAEIGHFVLKNICADVDKELTSALFGHDGALPSDEDVKKAEQLALALRRSSKLAGPLGIQREVTAKINEARQQVVDNTLAALRNTPRNRDGSMGADAQRQMFNGLRMVEILSGSDEAERLFREWNAQFR